MKYLEVSYNKLWKMLVDKGMNKGDLRRITGIATNTMAKLGKNQSVSLDVLMKICDALECNVEDICEFKK